MATVMDITEGNRGTLTADGWSFERVAKVAGVGGVGHARLKNAVEADGVPSIGDAHPTVADCELVSIHPESESQDIVKLRLVYQTPPALETEIEVGATLSEVTVDTDINGELMIVKYGEDETKDQAALVSIGLPRSTIRFRRREFESPGEKAREYVGKVNTAGWTVDSGAAARTWRCNAIVGRSADSGRSYDVDYDFEYDEETWDARVVWIKSETGRMPPDLDENGRRRFQVYREKGFNGLNLP